MSDNTKIEWTDATWNPITGCSVVSPGCTNCYAMKLAGTRLKHHPTRIGLTVDTKAGPVWNGKVRLNDEVLTQPLKWKRPRMIFVCAHGDLFHPDVPDEWIDKVFAVMALAPQHTFQVLTKRADRMREYVSSYRLDGQGFLTRGGVDGFLSEAHMPPSRWPLPNVWLGTSVEDQRRADERIPHLLQTPAAIRFLSAEPLLGPVNLNKIHDEFVFDGVATHTWESALNGKRFDIWSDGDIDGMPKLDWVIAGGESGPGARPMHPEWARSLRDQCDAAGVPFFFKQWGAWAEESETSGVHSDACYFPSGAPRLLGRAISLSGETVARAEPGSVFMRLAGKKAAGRLLDGVEHSGMPAHG